jgi:hypothetical protein
MVLLNSEGERIRRCAAPPLRQNIDGDATDMRLGDVYVASSAALAAFNGNLVKIGLNEGAYGVGLIWMYRATSLHGNTPNKPITSVIKYDYATNRDLDHFMNEKDLTNDILSTLRRTTFRLIAFADQWQDRVYSQIHPWSIRYTVPVHSRLTTPPTDSDDPQARCSQATHSRKGMRLR